MERSFSLYTKTELGKIASQQLKSYRKRHPKKFARFAAIPWFVEISNHGEVKLTAQIVDGEGWTTNESILL